MATLSCDATVITAVHNCEKHLEECVRSVQEQTLMPREHIIIDDCSTDTSYALAQHMAKTCVRVPIRVLQHPMNLGFPAALNTCIAASETEFVGILDSDDAALPHWLATAVPVLQADEQRMALKGLYRPLRCRLCFDKFNVLADLSLGDGYGSPDPSRFGANAILVRTPTGRNVLASCADALELARQPAPVVLEAHAPADRSLAVAAHSLAHRALWPSQPDPVPLRCRADDAVTRRAQALARRALARAAWRENGGGYRWDRVAERSARVRAAGRRVVARVRGVARRILRGGEREVRA